MPLNALKQLQTVIDTGVKHLGQLIAWLSLIMVIVMTVVVILRHGFGIGWIAMQESVVYMHALVFMLGTAYTLNHDEHVRVDVFYQKFATKTKAWIDLIGTLVILLPVCAFIFAYSFDYVIASWEILEGSGEAGGIPGVFALKTLLLIMPITLGLQGIATGIKNIVIIVDGSADKEHGEQA